MVKHETSMEAIEKSKRDLSLIVKDYAGFLDEARTPTMSVKAAMRRLDACGFVKFCESDAENDSHYLKKLRRNDKIYFVDRNGVNIAAVRKGNEDISEGINIAGAHVDFCTLTNKVNSIKEENDGVYLDTRPYGGFFPHQWMDRPLSVIGETLVKSGNGQRELVEWKIPGHIPEPTIHNPKGYREKKYTDAFNLENLDIFTGHKDGKAFLKALNEINPGRPEIKLDDFNSGFNLFHAVPAELTQVMGDYIAGYGHDDRACMFAALQAIADVGTTEYYSMALGVAREEIGSVGVGGANDVFLDNVIKVLCAIDKSKVSVEDVYVKSVMLSADVDIAFNPQNKAVNDKNNCSMFGNGAALVIANGHSGNPTGNIVMPKDLYFIEKFLDKKELAYQVTALPSKVGIGGGGGTIAKFYSEKGILTADLGVPVGNMHGTVSRIYSADLDSTVQAFIGLFERTEKRKLWG